jgi:predicted AlkP superfamily phosphohydrolase/phosphomutase
VITYLPVIDEIQHELFHCWKHGDPDEASSGARSVIRAAYALADDGLSNLLRLIDPSCTVVLCSDHGAGAVTRDYHLNQTLANAGLLRFDENGGIDPQASQAAYHPANNGSVWINDIGRKFGIVLPQERGSVVEAAERALLCARDPMTQKPAIDVARVEEDDRHLFGDLMIRLRPGYDSVWRSHPRGDEFAAARKGGTHMTPTGESTLNGVLAIRRSGLPAQLADGELTLMSVYDLIRRMLSP